MNIIVVTTKYNVHNAPEFISHKYNPELPVPKMHILTLDNTSSSKLEMIIRGITASILYIDPAIYRYEELREKFTNIKLLLFSRIREPMTTADRLVSELMLDVNYHKITSDMLREGGNRMNNTQLNSWAEKIGNAFIQAKTRRRETY